MTGTTGVSLSDLGISSNASGGVALGDNAFLREVIVGFNGGDGIVGAIATRLIDSTSSGNNGDGLRAGGSAEVRGGSFSDNAGDGIDAGSLSTVEGSRELSNGGRGIAVLFGSRVVDNHVNYNVGAGIDFGAAVAGVTTGYAGNVISANSGGERVGAGGTQLGTNICGDVICP